MVGAEIACLAVGWFQDNFNYEAESFFGTAMKGQVKIGGLALYCL